ncbi:MAG TPA: hypothetical protein VHC22_26450 [Pirellulales bacterium]|nr:hypothetical protein [Pirellulales bacterium]
MATRLRIVVLAVLFLPASAAFAQAPPFAAGSAYAANPGDDERPPEISPNAEAWRYTYRNGGWWYLSPERRWHYWSQGRWVEYLPPGRSNTPSYIQPPAPQRPARWRPFNGRFNAYRANPAAMPYGGAGYYGQVGVGVY